MKIFWVVVCVVTLGAGFASAERIYEQLPTRYSQAVEAASVVEYLAIYDQHNPQHSERRQSESLQVIDLYLDGHGYFTFVKVFPGQQLSAEQSKSGMALLLQGHPFWRPGEALDKNSCIDNDFEYVFRFQGPQETVEVCLSLHCLPRVAVCSGGKGCFYRDLTAEAANGWAELVESVTGEIPLR